MPDIELHYLQMVKSYISGLKMPLETDDPEDMFNKGALWAANRIEEHIEDLCKYATDKLDKTKHNDI